MQTNELILHHYDGSPFAEKVRLMLGFKGAAWRSVTIPRILPKPDVIALTGGYRKTPLLQQGRDIWCDTALIARRLEAVMPTPALYPASAPLAPMLAAWADSTLFWTVVPYTMQPAGRAAMFASASPEAVKAFADDRAPFVAPIKRTSGAEAAGHLHTELALLEATLRDGRTHLLGNEASIADFSVAHCLWYVRRGGPLAQIIDGYLLVAAWLARMLGLGHGRPSAMDSAQALATAAAATAFEPTAVEPGAGLEAGEAVTVTPTDYGCDPSAGALVGLSTNEVVIERRDARAGTVHVHFPRRGFQVQKQESTT